MRRWWLPMLVGILVGILIGWGVGLGSDVAPAAQAQTSIDWSSTHDPIRLPDGARVTLSIGDSGRRQVRYDWSGSFGQGAEYGPVDESLQRHGVWYNTRHEGPPLPSYWYMGREVENAVELERLMRQ